MVLARQSSRDSLRNDIPLRLPSCALCSFIITFVIVGVSVSISGPSVMFLEEIVHTWEDEIALIFTGRSVGALGGWLLSVAILEDTPEYCGSLIGFGLLGLAIVNFGVAFSYHLWWLLAAFAFQGSFIVVAAQGCLAYVTKHSGSPRRIHQLLVFCSLVGCALTPVLFIPFASEANFTNGSSLVPLADASTFVSNFSVTHTISRPPRSLNDDTSRTITESPVFSQTTRMYKTSANQDTNNLSTPKGAVIMSQISSIPMQHGNGNPSTLPPTSSSISGAYSAINSFVNSSTTLVNLGVNEAHVTTSSMKVFKSKPSSLSAISETPMKPSVVDAEHLNQDSSSADGSNTAAKMKLADGDVRLTNSEDSGILDAQEDGEMKKPSVVDATHLSQDQNTADGSSTADKMKHVDEKIHANDPELPVIIVPSLAPPALKPGPITNDTIEPSKPSILTTAIPPPKDNSISSLMSVEFPSQNHEPKLRSNDSYRLTSSYNTKWDRRTPRRSHDEHTRYQYMRSVRCVYVSVGLLTIIAWFILLPLTGLIPYVRHFFECFAIQTPHRQSSQVEDQSHRDVFNTKTNNDVERAGFVEDPQPEFSSLAENELPPPRIEQKAVAWGSEELEGQLQEKPMFHVSVSVPNFAVLRSVRHNPSQAHRKNVESTDIDANETFQIPEQSVYLNYAPEPTIWPLVTWPTDFWLFAATFLFAGLETTYGAFIHSFTLRTLNWTPVNALLIATIFWSGDAIGRLCHLCLGASSDMGISLLQNAVNFPSKGKLRSPSLLLAQSNCRRERSFHIAALFIRTVGSLICLICASMMKEMISSHLAYRPRFDRSGAAVFESWSTSKYRVTWMATLGLGLGLGATAGSGLNVYNSHSYRYYAAFLLGQLAVPATSGYLTERVLHKNASETLGRTTIILSILMFFSLLIDLLLRVFRCFFWWKIVLSWFSCFSGERKVKLENKRNDIGADAHVQSKGNPIDVAWGTPSSAPSIPLETRQKNVSEC